MTSVRRAAAVALAFGLLAPITPPATVVSAAVPCTISTDLKLGTQSMDVKCLEQRLVELGYRIFGPDPMFGTTTDTAVKAFQSTSALAVDGIVGPATGSALGLRIPIGSPIPPQGVVPPAIVETRTIGTSVQGRPIVAERMGTPGGRVVLVIGNIHGDEQKGVEVTRLLRTMSTPRGIDLWLVDSMNPDGFAMNTRQNANGVDLNRNFELGWSYIPMSTQHRQYSGEAPADQPETQAVQRFLLEIQPAIVLWFHQDANVITINGARREIPREYGRLVGLGTGNVPCSQLCTGTSSSYANGIPGTTSFLVELPGSAKVTPAMVQTHAQAILTVSVM